MREERFIEIDILRGISICLMVFLHFLWDLDFFRVYPLNKEIYQINSIVAFMFLCIVGICFSITNHKKTLLEQFKRGLWVFDVGLGLTIITLVFMPDRPILFGILHCIGFSVMMLTAVSWLFSMQWNNAVYGALKSFLERYAMHICSVSSILIVAIGQLMRTTNMENPSVFQLMLGFHQKDIWLHTIDFFPLVPWFSVVLFGVVAGEVLYRNGKRRFRIPGMLEKAMFFSRIGKNSLLIYLLHQPALLFLIKYVLIPVKTYISI